MTAALALPANTAATFLTRFFGPGLADDRHAVETLRAAADRDSRRRPDPNLTGGKGRKAVTATVSIPTSLFAVSLSEAFGLCDRLNRKLGLDRAAWTALVERCMHPAGGRTLH